MSTTIPQKALIYLMFPAFKKLIRNNFCYAIEFFKDGTVNMVLEDFGAVTGDYSLKVSISKYEPIFEAHDDRIVKYQRVHQKLRRDDQIKISKGGEKFR